MSAPGPTTRTPCPWTGTSPPRAPPRSPSAAPARSPPPT
nr:MAG TPA: hypothetical protein [Caudoviricetes sp.]